MHICNMDPCIIWSWAPSLSVAAPRRLGLPGAGSWVCKPQKCTALFQLLEFRPHVCAHACMYYVYPSVTVLRHSVKPVTGPGWPGLPVTSCTDTGGSLAQTYGLSSNCPSVQHLAQTCPLPSLSSIWPRLMAFPVPGSENSNPSYAGLVSASDGAGCEEVWPLVLALALGPLYPRTQIEMPLNKLRSQDRLW